MAVKPPKSVLSGHTAGIFADMTLDGPEIGTLVAVVDRAKNLPNRRTMGKQDPYCAMRLGKEAKKTDTDRRGGQTPKWDQELRFTVHDSPDYYKMKVSVFNDDKKTDLIGEAYVGLHDLIKPGGGSNDLWHQLNYKGKYAGDIRMEMTYYDVRPREEKPVEKRRHRDKAGSITSDAASSVSGPRQLGPREVRRRPLPTSPGAETPSPPITPQIQAPPPPPKIPLPQSSPSYAPAPPSERYANDQYAQDFNTILAQPRQNYPHPAIQQHYEPENDYRDFTPDEQYHQLPDQHDPVAYSSRSLSVLEQHSPSHTQVSDMWNESGRRHSENFEPNNTAVPAYNSPPPLNHASHSAPEVPQYRPYRASVSPTKALQYRDSPLRHSISQQEVPQDFTNEPEMYDTPPPPPKHRDGSARKLQSEYPPSAHAPQPLRPNPRRPSVEERSPLQHIERDFDPSVVAAHDIPHHHSYDMHEQSPTNFVDMPDRRGSHDVYSQASQPVSRVHSRQGSFDPYRDTDTRVDHSPEPRPYFDDQQASADARRQHVIHDQIDVYGRRNSRNAFVQEQQTSPGPYQRGYSQGYDEPQMHNEYIAANQYDPTGFSRSQASIPTNNSSPAPIRPRPQKVIPTQIPGHIPARKAVSPGPYPGNTARRLSETPFGPDDYDVLNPASGPATNEHTPYETPEQSKEAARLREVDKLRDQGPIIGNDGRVIDPSDHLPSDTWAPEPEKKNRKPEHVIHIRTRNDIRGPVTPRSSPASIRTSVHRDPMQGSPVSPSPIATPPSTGRARLQKSMPTRPLPTQPYQQPFTPATFPEEPPPIQQIHKRNSYHDMSPGVERPSLSEYQVPASNTYSPRGSTYQISNNHQPTPPRMPYVEDYSPNRFSDPLAAEMSMIDIGPSRGGRTTLRPNRGY